MKEDIRGGMKLGRTCEGTVFEVVAVLMLIIMWAVAMWFVLYRGVDIEQQVINCGIATATVPVMLIAAYYPALINLPVVVTTPAQLRLLIRLERIAALEVIAMLFGMNLALTFDGREQMVLMAVVIMAACAVIVATAICGVFMISKRGS